MIDILTVYICPKHGEILEDEVERVEIIDCENDEVYVIPQHNRQNCFQNVTPKTVEINGRQVQCLASVDHERWLWATGAYDDLLLHG